MMKGRGATTCLICDKGCDHVVYNNMGIIYGIKLLFDTDQFNIMLMSSQICIKCAGRLHQLFDFNLIQQNLDTQKRLRPVNLEDAEALCSFCEDTNILLDNFKQKADDAIAATKLATRQNTLCCFSCYNYLLLYKKIKNIFDTQLIKFYTSIKSWRVVVKQHPKIKAELGLNQVIDLDGTSFDDSLATDDTTLSASPVKSAAETKAKAKSSWKKFEKKMKSETFSSTDKISKKSKAKVSRPSLKRLQESTRENIDDEDEEQYVEPKFLPLKKPRPNPQTQTAVTESEPKRAHLPMIEVKKEPEIVSSTVVSYQETVNENSLVQVSTTSDEMTPIINDKLLPRLLSPVSDQTFLNESPEYGDSLAINYSSLSLQVDTSIYPALDVIDDAASPTNMDDLLNRSPILSDEEMFAMHQLVPCTVQLSRTDPAKLQKILGERMPKSKIVTKSGRMPKPKDRLDPSPKTKRRQTKTHNLKFKISSKKRDKDKSSSSERKSRKHRHSGKESKKLKAKTDGSRFVELQMPEDGLPDDIVEDYVDYSTNSPGAESDGSPISSANYSPDLIDEDDEAVVDINAKANERTIEFCSPRYMHKGKIGPKDFQNLSHELCAKGTTEGEKEVNKSASDENSTNSVRVIFKGKSGPGVVRNLANELVDDSTDSETKANQYRNLQDYNQSSTDELKSTIDPQSTSQSSFIKSRTETSSSQAAENSSKAINAASPINPLISTAITSQNKQSSTHKAAISSVLTTSEEISSIYADRTEREESTTVNDATSQRFADNEASHSPLTRNSMEEFDAIDVVN